MQATTDRLSAARPGWRGAGGLRDDLLHADLKGKTPLPSPRLACLAHPVRHEDAARFSAGNEMSANLSRASSGKKPVAGGRAVQEALTKRRGITLLKAYYVVGFGEAGGGVSETRAFNPATNRSEKTMSGAARATADEKRYLDSAEAMIQTVPSGFVDALKTAAANRFSGRCAA